MRTLYTEYGDRGLVVLAFPCNQFANQEPGTNSEIYKFVTEKYPVDSAFFYFETPNYKVRVGKFKSRIIAEKKLREIKQIFKSAFINAET